LLPVPVFYHGVSQGLSGFDGERSFGT